ncbi:predicted protein [Streptomyces sp. SPB78]|nr:predicted protein [Streptomyces sp. SPB78]
MPQQEQRRERLLGTGPGGRRGRRRARLGRTDHVGDGLQGRCHGGQGRGGSGRSGRGPVPGRGGRARGGGRAGGGPRRRRGAGRGRGLVLPGVFVRCGHEPPPLKVSSIG